jgi:GNAT superfamily N-acetyltransferase
VSSREATATAAQPRHRHPDRACTGGVGRGGSAPAARLWCGSGRRLGDVRLTSTTPARARSRWPSAGDVDAHFSSWPQALAAADLRPHRRTWTPAAIIAALQAWAAAHRRAPRHDEWRTASLEHPSAGAVKSVFAAGRPACAPPDLSRRCAHAGQRRRCLRACAHTCAIMAGRPPPATCATPAERRIRLPAPSSARSGRRWRTTSSSCARRIDPMFPRCLRRSGTRSSSGSLTGRRALMTRSGATWPSRSKPDDAASRSSLLGRARRSGRLARRHLAQQRRPGATARSRRVLAVPAARGRGVATHAVRLIGRWAFEDLELARLELTCAPDNHASQQVAARCGFTREGLLRSHVPFNGGRRDSVMFSLLPGEMQ